MNRITSTEFGEKGIADPLGGEFVRQIEILNFKSQAQYMIKIVV